MNEAETMILRVAKSLGRSTPLTSAPTPPEIPDQLARLVARDADLVSIFQQRASALKMLVSVVTSETLVPSIVDFLRQREARRIMLSSTPLLLDWKMADLLNQSGFDARWWHDITLDDTYDFDAGVTEVDYAVAESGTLTIRHTPAHGRLLSLAPFFHIAVVEARKIVPDLLDQFDLLNQEGTGSGVTMISGPSKTADIEMNVVTGVHGPNVVQAFILT